MPAYAHIDGETVLTATLHVPNIGPWWCDVVFELAPEVSGSVTLTIGQLVLTGTVSPNHNGTFGAQRRARVVAGAGNWGGLITARHYHNDAGDGVRAQTIAENAASDVGETIGAFVVDATHVGIDYVRQSGTATQALEDVIGNAPWHVGYDGVTNVGARASAEVADSDYQVTTFEPASKVLVLTTDDLTKVVVGSILSEALDAPETVTELRIEVTSDTATVTAWTGGQLASSHGRLATALLAVIAKARSDKLPFKYRYRFVQMSTNRTELQAVSVIAGLPDVLPVAMKPGVAGAHAKLTPGSIVLVEFIEGDRTQPVVVAFEGKGSDGHVTDELDFSVTTMLRLGSDAATEGVPLGDSLKTWLDNHVHAYIDTIGGPTGVPTPSLTTAPATAPGPPPTGLPIVADTSPDPSTKVVVE